MSRNMLRACKQYEFNSSTDSQFTETEEDISFYEACVDCDEDALYDIIQDGVVYEQVNERDRSGRVSDVVKYLKFLDTSVKVSKNFGW